MTRAEIVLKIRELFEPLGPLGDPDERWAAFELWARTDGPDNLDALLDLVSRPPDAAELDGQSAEAFAFALATASAQAGAADRGAFVARAAALLADRQARPAIIETLGLLGGAEAEAALAPLADASDLSEDEAVRLACAFGDAAGPNARTLLARLRARAAQERPAVQREIEIALAQLAR